MAFNVKELMIDITKAGIPQNICHPTVICGYPTYYCRPCTYHITYCVAYTYQTCQYGTYTCYGSIITCGGTIYCAGSNDPTILYQGIDRQTLTAIKAQLNSALKEVQAHEKRLGEAGRKAKK